MHQSSEEIRGDNYLNKEGAVSNFEGNGSSQIDFSDHLKKKYDNEENKTERVLCSIFYQ